ncbi:MAG: sulfite exporter TauE/SafE family protein [Chloroflexota bacterium]|nr:MAG: sulfite exporter TauE/SafE family protein [Chloroflexota bacterium]
MDLRFSLLGLIIGFLIGLTGMGGGSLMTPVMILVMGVKPYVAVGTDLAYGAVTRIFGARMHMRHDTVNRRTAYLLALGSVPATVLGVSVTSALKKAHPNLVNVVLVRSIAWALIVVGIVLASKSLWTSIAARYRKQHETNWRDNVYGLGDTKPWVLPILGAFVGFAVGLTSVGAGTLIIMAFLFLFPRWESKQYVGTDVFHGAILVSAAGLAHLVAGNVNIVMMLSLLVGSIPGVLLGSRLVVSFHEQYLRLTLASVLLISGFKLL